MPIISNKIATTNSFFLFGHWWTRFAIFHTQITTTYTIPMGVTKICALVYGGGASGIMGNYGNGGGAGGLAISVWDCVPNTQLSLIVGAQAGTSSLVDPVSLILMSATGANNIIGGIGSGGNIANVNGESGGTSSNAGSYSYSGYGGSSNINLPPFFIGRGGKGVGGINTGEKGGIASGGSGGGSGGGNGGNGAIILYM